MKMWRKARSSAPPNGRMIRSSTAQAWRMATRKPGFYWNCPSGSSGWNNAGFWCSGGKPSSSSGPRYSLRPSTRCWVRVWAGRAESFSSQACFHGVTGDSGSWTGNATASGWPAIDTMNSARISAASRSFPRSPHSRRHRSPTPGRLRIEIADDAHGIKLTADSPEQCRVLGGGAVEAGTQNPMVWVMPTNRIIWIAILREPIPMMRRSSAFTLQAGHGAAAVFHHVDG